jgi:hypothetical protein
MNSQLSARLRLLSVFGISMLVVPILSSAAPAATKYQYEDEYDPLLKPSKGCAHFKKVQVPISNAGNHSYVLLLVFDTPEHADKAGQQLFHADPASPPPGTFGCMKDPALLGTAQEEDTVLKVKGCPSDCFGPKMIAYRKEVARDNGADHDNDPLYFADPKDHKVHWGIFFADADAAGNSDSQVRVWQIRVADATHATQILLSIKKLLKEGCGYMGNMLVGYQPMPTDSRTKH